MSKHTRKYCIENIQIIMAIKPHCKPSQNYSWQWRFIPKLSGMYLHLTSYLRRPSNYTVMQIVLCCAFKQGRKAPVA